ncbi:MAG: ribonuclease HII [Clostridia bacterium]|nr:ribonuclease HII [Clostridia bacterium]MBR5942512.1 ribonuclease HII [Clostridia bacterium]
MKDNGALFEYDSAVRAESGVTLLCGVDEAGRGPLAGPVCAAAVILPEGVIVPGVNDSKKVSEPKREELFGVITETALAWAVAFSDEKEIDEINILNAAMLAMKRAVEALSVRPELVLCDGNKLPRLDVPARYVIKGDATSASIAAASILAKVSRDRLMYEYDEKYPEYGFGKHKGYGTKQHYDAIERYGVLDIHRKTFLKGRV